MLSVSTKVPATNATPSAMDSDVSRSRSLCAVSPRIATRNIGSAPQVLHVVENAGGGRVVHLVDHAAVGEEQDVVGVRRSDRVVRAHHDGLAELTRGPLQEAQQLGRGVRVESTGRLVGKDDVGLAGERSGGRDPLLLATG